MKGRYFSTALIQVTPDILNGKATELRGLKSEHDEAMSKMRSLIMGLNEVWKGDAQDAYVAKYESMQNSFFAIYFADRYAGRMQARKAGAPDPEKMSPWVGGFYVCFWCAMTVFYDIVLWGNLIRDAESKAFDWTCCILSTVALLGGLILLFALKDAIAMWFLIAGCIIGPVCLSNNYLYTALGVDDGNAMGIWLWLHVFGSLLIGVFTARYLANKENAKHVK